MLVRLVSRNHRWPRIALAVLLLCGLVGIQAGLTFHHAHHGACSTTPTSKPSHCVLCQVATYLFAVAVAVISLVPVALCAFLPAVGGIRPHRLALPVATARAPPVVA